MQDTCKILKDIFDGVIVMGNKAVVAKPIHPVSICSSSRADFLAYHPHHHKVILIEKENVDTDDEDEKSFVAESNTIKVNKLHGLVVIRGLPPFTTPLYKEGNTYSTP